MFGRARVCAARGGEGSACVRALACACCRVRACMPCVRVFPRACELRCRCLPQLQPHRRVEQLEVLERRRLVHDEPAASACVRALVRECVRVRACVHDEPAAAQSTDGPARRSALQAGADTGRRRGGQMRAFHLNTDGQSEAETGRRSWSTLKRTLPIASYLQPHKPPKSGQLLPAGKYPRRNTEIGRWLFGTVLFRFKRRACRPAGRQALV